MTDRSNSSEAAEPGQPCPKRRVAAYFRSATTPEEESISVQVEAVVRYADEHDMQLVRTYCDQGKSGLLIDDRPGLQQLLRDIETRAGDFGAVLLLDSTRWGRFPDAHAFVAVEIARRNADIEIHYCACRFVEAQSPISSIIKSIKRVMAREYSRELTRPKRRRDGAVTRRFSAFANANASTRRANVTGVPGDAAPAARKRPVPG